MIAVWIILGAIAAYCTPSALVMLWASIVFRGKARL